MIGRWRQEIAKHAYSGGLSSYGAAPLPPVPDGDSCHCFRGMGFVRKRKPLDCGRARCYVCHGDKLYDGGRRKREEREALRREWVAQGGW